MVIGVTGKYCSGKNEAVRVLVEAGYPVIDVDRIGHEALEARKEAVLRRFGENLLLPNGRIDRKRLGNIVFRHGKELKALENIVHPYIIEKVSALLVGPGAHEMKTAVINAALLFPLGLDALCGRIIIVRASLPRRILRARGRDGISIIGIFRRMWAQRKLIPQPSLLPADTLIVENSGTQGELQEKIIRIVPGPAG